MHQGICVVKSPVEFECDCLEGYYGIRCERSFMSTWLGEIFTVGILTKQKLALSWKLVWTVVNNIPFLHNLVLRHVYKSTAGSEGRQAWDFNEYKTMDGYYNDSYALRSLPPVPINCPTPMGISGPKSLPSVDLIFDKLFKRMDFKPCPYGTNVMFATFSQHLMYQFMKTDYPKVAGLRVGSDGADVSQIYGIDEETRKALRSMVKGKLKVKIINNEEYPPYLDEVTGVSMVYPKDPSVLTSQKLVTPKWAMGHPLLSSSPLMFTLATLWLREHNRVCDMLTMEHPQWDDDRLYHTARWIILGELLTITAGEFIQHLAQYRLRFGFKPHLMHDFPLPMSNRIQYEFNLMSQWHQTLPDVMTVQGNYYNMSELLFSNNRLVFEQGLDAVINAMTRTPSGQITYRNCGPTVAKAMKQLIMEGRKNRLHSLNSYRKFYDMQPFKTFMDLVQDKEIAKTLEDLYGDVDAVELMVGIFMEKPQGSVIPPTMISLAGPVAISGIMGNPIGSPHIWRPSTFGGKKGFDTVRQASLRNLVCHNLKSRCRNNVWVSFRTPKDIIAHSKNFIASMMKGKK